MDERLKKQTKMPEAEEEPDQEQEMMIAEVAEEPEPEQEQEKKMPEAAEEPKHCNFSVRSLVLLSVLAAEFYLEKKCYYDFIVLFLKAICYILFDTYPLELLREIPSCQYIWTRTHSPTVCSL